MTTRISDLIVPEIFTPYARLESIVKSRLFQSGAVVESPVLNRLLAGGGTTFNVPSFLALPDDASNQGSDDPATDATPNNIGTAQEVAARITRSQVWSSMDLNQVLTAEDPLREIARQVGGYWRRAYQKSFVAMMVGIFADNDAAPSGSEHVQYDLTNDVKGSSLSVGTTTITRENINGALLTMGDSIDEMRLMLVHPVVHNRMLNNNLIDVVLDSVTGQVIRRYGDMEVVIDASLPNPAASGVSQTSTGIYETWLFGAGAVAFGETPAPNAEEVERQVLPGNGFGRDLLASRRVYAFHLAGMKYAGTAPDGGPTDAGTSNNLGAAGSWQRVYNDRRYIKVARLVTRES